MDATHNTKTSMGVVPSVCATVLAVLTSVLFGKTWGNEVYFLGFGVGLGLGAFLGFALDLFIRRRPFPSCRACFILINSVAGGAVVTVAVLTDLGMPALIAVVVWTAGTFGMHLASRQDRADRKSQ